MCILPLQRGRFDVFWIDGIPRSVVHLPHSDKFIGYQFTLHSRPTRRQMMEAARRDKNGVLQSVPWSAGRSLRDVTTASRGSPNQPFRRNQTAGRKLLLKCGQKIPDAVCRYSRDMALLEDMSFEEI